MNTPAPALAGAASAPWPFGALRPLSYDVIHADPPWLLQLRSTKGEAKSPQAQYRCMPTAEIAALPVHLLARGDAWLVLWATFPMIADALAVMGAWRFRYVTGGTWIKRGASGKLAMGAGYVLRGNAELFLIGRIGALPTWSRSIRNVIEAPRREHSRKPDAIYALCEALFGPAWRLDLFSRQSRPGWDGWGDQAGHFDPTLEPPPRMADDRDVGRPCPAFDCCACGRSIVLIAGALPEPRHCAACQAMPGWFRDPDIRAVIAPGHDGRDRRELLDRTAEAPPCG